MNRVLKALLFTVCGLLCLAPAGSLTLAQAAEVSSINAPPTARDWQDIAKLPDWSGVWTPAIIDQFRQMTTNPTPWNAAAAAKVAALTAQERAGDPKGLFLDCLPEAMPSWMLISHNAFEVLFTPGRVTLLGESDSNRLRRIYTDGRGHSPDPDPSFHGESIGHWDNDVLVIDTIGVLPQTYLAISEAVGLPNNGDLHVFERMHLSGPDTLVDELEITAPHILTAPWKTTRTFYRQRARKYEIVEGICLQGDYKSARTADGDYVFKRRHIENGNVLPDK